MTTETTQPSHGASGGEATFAERRRRAVGALRQAIEHSDPGALAALRRLNPSSPGTAFYRLTTTILDDIEPSAGPRRDEADRRWAVIARALAAGVGLFSGTRLGTALSLADVAELRVLRLLEARGPQLADVLFGVLHQLASRGQDFNPQDVAALVLSDGGPDEESARRAIARDFYRNR